MDLFELNIFVCSIPSSFFFIKCQSMPFTGELRPLILKTITKSYNLITVIGFFVADPFIVPVCLTVHPV